jgi:hypothetical protein
MQLGRWSATRFPKTLRFSKAPECGPAVALILEKLISHGNDEILPNLRRVAYLALPVRLPAAGARSDSKPSFFNDCLNPAGIGK